ncbi:hypothetical protein SELMODRAFT_138761 [Selaginella moellendorffii]|uniref:Uncharacterized protein n=1 Tax=Selaginella moellendorffii TaxID=88036 RepID=D8TG06_SELML|nr:11-beta-hydroxysteroid dehydrogenase 1B isoform X3 [Selaginella moellendorffii]EFJ04409.1 hypothetical protein SELMODRAFT_138761 [Selaginella moellendorffii]|eukprot:XP_024523807.1 11-beta-hydroxysteroid dehydrogenase 1B isoform X3 [Selaginella moellendorffii]
MDLVQFFLNLVVPPMGLFFLALAWPPLTFMNACHWFLSFVFRENVRGKVVVVTGATSGIGEKLSYEYASHGAKLILVGNQEGLLRDVAGKCQRIGAMDVRIVTADLGHEEECKRFVEETVHQFGRLDHLVNNAGIMHSYLFEEAVDVSSFQSIMDVTFWGSVYPTYYALPHLKRSGGKVVVNSSVSAWLPMPRLAIYNAAEAALLNLFDTLRVEVGNSVGITIATPGWVESEITRGKFISAEGEHVTMPDLRDVTVGPVPVTYAEECAKAIFSGTVRGARYVRVPSWYGVTLLYRIFAPELIEWTYRLLFVSPAPGTQVPAAKLIMDVPGAKEILYPSSIVHPQKTE